MKTEHDLRAERHGGDTGGLRLGGAPPGGMADLLRLMGAEGAGLGSELPVPIRRLHDGDTLFHEGSHAEAIHFVRAGTFKIFSTAGDGYEQVLGFAGRGEVLGFDAICTGQHPSEALALEDSSVYVLLLRDYVELGQRLPAFERMVLRAASAALARRGELADVMAAVAAEVRLARFLIHLSDHLAAAGQSPRRFLLRMGRRDIGSYLGVAHETVSRSFSALVTQGLVRVDNREVEIVDLEGLKAFSCGTRRQLDDGPRLHGQHPHAGTEHAPAPGCPHTLRQVADAPGPGRPPRLQSPGA